eukprot:1161861-Pelagomonas_calceolata.AAC.3
MKEGIPIELDRGRKAKGCRVQRKRACRLKGHRLGTRERVCTTSAFSNFQYSSGWPRMGICLNATEAYGVKQAPCAC